MIENHELFRVNQRIILFNKKREALLLQHESGKWLLPGGRINVQETWEDGLRRELQEEVGITDFSIEEIVAVNSWVASNTGPHYCVTFLGMYTGDNTLMPDNEIIGYAWITNRELNAHDIWFDETRQVIKKVLNDET